MIPQTTLDQARSTDLVSLAGRYTTLRREAAKEMSGPCPKCGGVDRFHVKPDGWFCRQCHPDFGDAIELVRWASNVDFATAVYQLTGEMPPAQLVRPKPKVPPAKPPDWLDDAEQIVDSAHVRLMECNSAGADYLISRGLQPPTWEAFRLGYREDVSLPSTGGKFKAPAIVLPWVRGGKLTAIRYRFLQTHEYIDLEGKPRKAKQTSMPDSDFAGCLYGGQGLLGCAEPLRTLVLCEGEINALSIWQTCHGWNWDVLSLGSESARLTSAMVDYARRFERVIVWMDKPEVAKQMQAIIGSGAWAMNSLDGERDANDLLQVGHLGGLLATARYEACETNTERGRLLWNLWDSELDPGARQVMEDIANKLGRQV